MLRIRTCPRCRGNVLVDWDRHGWYEHCLQCGYQRDLEDVEKITAPATKAEKASAKSN